METTKRKVSPRAPSLPLDEALARVAKMYKEEGRHAAPVEVAMKHIGYSGKNGAALQAVASLRYWGLVERPKEGFLMVTKAFEDHEFTPDESHKHELVVGFLKTPPLFADLLEKYKDRLPSDANIKFDLIQRGFSPASADGCLAVFRKSVEFTRFYNAPPGINAATVSELEPVVAAASPTPQPQATTTVSEQERTNVPDTSNKVVSSTDAGMDRIPVRLAGGRRAWLEIPTPFFTADKKRLKKHIDLIFTDDEDEDDFGDEADENE